MICPSCKAENDDSADNCLRCGKGLFALTVGALLNGRYEILGPIGRGGMGMVYKALDRELDETVAIKILRSEAAVASEMTKRFRGEIKLARKVSHPNVCRIHEYGKEGHVSYIVMEFVEGRDLKRIIREKGPLPLEEAYDVASELADALHAIHSVGIVHRDVKTPNIMRDGRGIVKLMDFGIAKRMEAEDSTPMTATGHILGTPEYMSPEQARAERIDARTDLYALGIVVFELFTGDVPLRGETPLATILKQLQELPPLEGEKARRLPPPLVPVLRKALAKDRDQRFATAGEMAEAIRQARMLSLSPAMWPTEVPLLAATVPQALPLADTTLTPTPVPTAVPTATQAAAADPSARVEKVQAKGARPISPPRLLPGGRSRPRTIAGHEPHGQGARLWILAGAAVAVAAGLVYQVRRTLPSEPTLVSRQPHRSETRATPPSVGVTEDHSPSVTATAAVLSPRTQDSLPPVTTLPQARTTGKAASERPETRHEATRPAPTPIDAATIQMPASLVPTASPPTIAPPASSPTAVIVAGPTTTMPPLPSETPPPLRPDAEEAPARVQIGVKPWAEVTLDDKPLGISPISTLSLSAGAHSFRFVHPDYQPIVRRITIRAGETIRLSIDFGLVGVPKK